MPSGAAVLVRNAIPAFADIVPVCRMRSCRLLLQACPPVSATFFGLRLLPSHLRFAVLHFPALVLPHSGGSDVPVRCITYLLHPAHAYAAAEHDTTTPHCPYASITHATTPTHLPRTTPRYHTPALAFGGITPPPPPLPLPGSFLPGKPFGLHIQPCPTPPTPLHRCTFRPIPHYGNACRCRWALWRFYPRLTFLHLLSVSSCRYSPYHHVRIPLLLHGSFSL